MQCLIRQVTLKNLYEHWFCIATHQKNMMKRTIEIHDTAINSLDNTKNIYLLKSYP